MGDFDKISKEIVEQLENVSAPVYYDGDLSDIGNEIGMVIGRYLEENKGATIEDFIRGLRHGKSLIDGTH